MKQRSTGAMAYVALAAIGALALIAFRALAVEAAYPVERVQQTFVRKVLTRVSGFFHGAEARAENLRLKREVASLALLRTDIERLETENARLRLALDYRARHREDFLAAGVLSRGGGAAGAHETLRVDKGTLSGVTKGAVVVVPDGLVGRVESVTPHTAEVKLITDPSLKVSCSVAVEGQMRPLGILAGGDEDSLSIRHLTGAEGVPARSQVFTSGLGGIFPKGLPVGTFLDVRKGVGGLASEGEVQPAVDFSTLEDVFIRRAL